MTKDSITIDFRKMMLEEKRKARQLSQPTQTEQGRVLAEPEPEENRTRGIDETITLRQEDWKLMNLTELDPSKHCISNNPMSVYYISRFLHDQYQEQLIHWLQCLPNAKPEQHPNGCWTAMRYGKRRVALFDGLSQELPLPLQEISNALVTCGVFDGQHQPNHVLVNEYTATQGILPHTDGPLYYDRTATLSIGGGDVLLKFIHRLRSDQIDPNKIVRTVMEVWLEGCGSLVVFCNDAYTQYCHGIDDNISIEHASEVCANAPTGKPIERGYRISLTFRYKLS